jgi:hypothetical protein
LATSVQSKPYSFKKASVYLSTGFLLL